MPPIKPDMRFRARILLTFLCASAALLSINLETGIETHTPNRVVTVVMRYSGIDATELERVVNEPLELSLSHVPGIETIRSATEAGRVRMTLTVRGDTTVDAAYIAIRNAVNRLYTRLPEAVERPRLYRGDTTSPPLMVFALHPRGDQKLDLRRTAENELSAEIERIPGVAEARVIGGTMEEIQVDVSSSRLAVADIPLSTVHARLTDRHSLTSAGILRDGRTAYPVVIDARLRAPSALSAVSIPSTEQQLDMSEIAEVRTRPRRADTFSRIDSAHRIIIRVTPAADANVLNTAAHIRAHVARWPEEYSVGTDMIHNAAEAESARVRATSAAVGASVTAVLLVIGVGSGSAAQAIRTALVLPLSILVSLGVFAATGQHVNTGVLAGLAVASGLVVDSAIVLTRTSPAQRSPSRSPHAIAATASVRRIEYNSSTTLPAVLTSAITTVTALTPFFLFPELLVGAASIARAASILVAVSVPCSLVIRECRFFETPSNIHTGKTLPRLAYTGGVYLERIVTSSAHHPRAIVVAASLISIGTATLLSAAGSDSSPLFQGRTFRIHAEFESGASAESVDRRTHELFHPIREAEGVRRLETTARRDNSTVTVTLEDGHRWSAIDPIIQRIDNSTRDVSVHTVSRTRGSTPIEFAITGPMRSVTRDLAGDLATKLMQNGRASRVIRHYKEDPPALAFHPDRRSLADNGVSAAALGEALRLALHGAVALKWLSSDGETDVRLRSREQPLPGARTLLSHPLRTGFGTIPVHDVATLERSTRPSRIDRYNLQRASLLTASYPTRSLERALVMFRDDLDSLSLPSGYAVTVDYRFHRQIHRYRLLWISLAATTTAIVLVIATAGESIRLALLCLFALPPTVACAVLPFLPGGEPIPAAVIVALVMLVGTSVNNGILVGLEAKTGNYCDSVLRRAPDLLMTSLTSAVASVPLMFAGAATGITGTMAVVLLFGSLGSLLVTFVVLPACGALLASKK